MHLFCEHLFEPARILPTEAVRTERWKDIGYVDRKPVCEQLFDLRGAPYAVRTLILQKGCDAAKPEMRSKQEMRSKGEAGPDGVRE